MIKNIIPILIISSFLFNCDLAPGEGEAPFKGEVKTKVIDKKGNNKIIVKVTFLANANYYHKYIDETFLLNGCGVDCNEDLKKTSWSNDDNGDYYAFLIENSNRFDATTRLALYSFKDDTVVELLDSKDVEISDFWFTDTTFVFQLDAGVKETIELK